MVGSREVKERARSIGFSAVGILSLEQLSNLPVGNVEGVHTLVPASDELPSVRSAIVLGYHIWDPIFNVHTLDPRWRGIGLHSPNDKFEFHQLYSEVVGRKAWQLAGWLRGLGFDAVPTNELPLKRAAPLAGLGMQGRNTVLISEEYGPNLRLGAVLTSAVLESDAPFTRDLCGDCTRCIRACPTGALKPHEVTIKRCMVYALENPESSDVDDDVKAMADKLIIRPTKGSFIECTRCLDACPYGKGARKKAAQT
jgi:epoxyqueuosine reductase QueG